MVGRNSKIIRAAEFARRLGEAADGKGFRNPGRQKKIVDELKNVGVTVSSETVSKWFAGEVTPRSEKLAPLAKLLGVKPEFLIFGTADTSKDASKNLQLNQVSLTHTIKVDAVLTTPIEVDNLVRKLLELKKTQWPSG